MNDFISKERHQSFDGMLRFNSDLHDDHFKRQTSCMNVRRCTAALSSNLPLFTFPIVWKTEIIFFLLLQQEH